MSDALAVVPLRAKEGDQRQLGDADDEHERRERPESVHEVGARELTSALERAAEAEPLDHRGRNGEAEEREPCDRGEHEEAHEERHGCEDEHRADVRGQRRRCVEDETARPEERRSHERPEGEEHEGLHVRGVAERQLRRHREWNTERKRAPELLAVHADRLRDELADGALGGRQRGRQLRH